MIRYRNGDDAALPVGGYIRFADQIMAGILHAPVPIDLSKIELVDQVVLNGAAFKNSDKQIARCFEPQDVSRNSCQRS